MGWRDDNSSKEESARQTAKLNKYNGSTIETYTKIKTIGKNQV